MLMPFPVSYFPRPHCHGISRWFFKRSRRPLPFLRRIEIMGSSSTTVSWKFWQKPRTKGRISGVLWEERFIAAVRRMMTFQRRAVYRSSSRLWSRDAGYNGNRSAHSDQWRLASIVSCFLVHTTELSRLDFNLPPNHVRNWTRSSLPKSLSFSLVSANVTFLLYCLDTLANCVLSDCRPRFLDEITPQ